MSHSTCIAVGFMGINNLRLLLNDKKKLKSELDLLGFKKKSFLSSSSDENNIKKFSMILYQTVFVFAFIIFCLSSSFTCQYKSCFTSFLFLFYSSLKP